MSSEEFNIDDYDNGGAVSKRGFKYQDTIASLIIITNYKKDNFSIYLESKDDIEVKFSDLHFFIQVKSGNLSINKLLSVEKKDKKSILYKSLSKTPQKKSRYKIVMPSFNEKDKNKLQSLNGILFKNIYQYSDEQKKTIKEKLIKEQLTENDINKRLENSFIYFSPFDGNLETACNCLLGIMTENNISVDNNRGKMALLEVLHSIDLKSQKKITNEIDVENKKISSSDIEKIFKVEICFEYMKQIIQKMENAQHITFSEKIELEKLIRTVDLRYKAYKKEIEMLITEFDKIEVTASIKKAFEQVEQNLPHISKMIAYAILIDKYVMDSIK